MIYPIISFSSLVDIHENLPSGDDLECAGCEEVHTPQSPSGVYVSNEMNIMANLETSYLCLIQFLITSQKLTFELK